MNPAKTITQRSGDYSGRGMLTAELLVAFVIVAIRIVADFSATPVPAGSGGSGNLVTKGNVLHPRGQYGPFPIAVALVLTFFALSFVAVGGGRRAKVAVILGGTIVLALGMKSVPEIEKITGTIGAIGTITVPKASGTESGLIAPAPAAAAGAGTGTGAGAGTPAGNSLSAANRAALSQHGLAAIADLSNAAFQQLKVGFTGNTTDSSAAAAAAIAEFNNPNTGITTRVTDLGKLAGDLLAGGLGLFSGQITSTSKPISLVPGVNQTQAGQGIGPVAPTTPIVTPGRVVPPGTPVVGR